MGVIMHNNIQYGGGSSIEPNPQESATEQLETLGIDGDVYEVTDANAIHTSDVGVANGIAELDSNGKVPKAELPSDVVYDNPTFTEASTRANIASGETIATILGKIKKWFSDLKTVAFTGAYSDLSGTPTIPTVNDATLTIQKNGTAVETFTANSSTNKTANITVPTKLTDLTNDLKILYGEDDIGGSASYTAQTEYASVKFALVRHNTSGINLDQTGYGGGLLSIRWPNGNYNSELFMGMGDKPDLYHRGLNGTAGSYSAWRKLAFTDDIVDTHVSQTVNNDSSYFRPLLIGASGSGTEGFTPSNVTDIAYTSTNIYAQISTGTLAAKILKGQLKNSQFVSLSSLDANTWYPVTGSTIPSDGIHRLAVDVHLNSGTVPSWSNHNRGFSVNLEMLAIGCAWGVTPGITMCLNHSTSWLASGESHSPCGYQQMTNSSTPVFWCRGGGAYYIFTDYPCTWTVRTSSYTTSNQTVSPTTTYPDISFAAKGTIYANLNGTANRSQIADQVNNWYSSRPTSADVEGNNLGGLRKFLATSSMSTNKPMGDGHIIHLDWDNGGDNCAQLFIPRQSTNHMQYRSQNDGTTWPTTWTTLIDSNNIASYLEKPLYATGSVGSGKTGVQKIAQITLSEVGTYYITGWAKFTGGGKKAVQLWCAGTLGESWEDSTIASGEPKTFSTFAIYTSTVANEDVKVNSYTVSASNAVTGGLVAIKVS